MRELRASSYVLDVSPSIEHFSAEFKVIFWEGILAGKEPGKIVEEIGIDPDALGENRLSGLKGMLRREVESGKGFRDLRTYDTRLSTYANPQGRIKFLEQQLAYKNQEIEFLKNCAAKGRQGHMSVPVSAKYKIIEEMTKRDNNQLNITWLCSTVGVSCSGYYNYLQTAEKRQQQEEKDRQDFQLVLEVYKHRGYTKGARGIYMRFLHMDPPVHVNIKKICRLMKKYGLHCPVRKAKPYHRMAKALRTNHVAPNLLNREFET